MNNDEASTAVDDPRVAWPPATVSTMPTNIPTEERDERPPPRREGARHYAAHERLSRRICIDAETGCWNFTGALTVGYGRIRSLGRLDLTHRVAYDLWVGDLVDGMQIDHLCRNRQCCNPTHLEQVTPLENQRRGSPRQEACMNGHLFAEHGYESPTSSYRRCERCANDRRNEARRSGSAKYARSPRKPKLRYSPTLAAIVRTWEAKS